MTGLAQERAATSDLHSVQARIDAVIVSHDDALLIELGPLVGHRFRTHTVDAVAEIASNVSAARWLGLIDEASLSDARAAIARLEGQFPRCPLLLLAQRPEEWASAVARGALIAVVGRSELGSPRLAEALTAAEARLRAEPAHAEAELNDTGSSAGGSPRSRLGWIVGAAVLAIALGGGAWWWLGSSHGQGRTTAGAFSPTPGPVAAGPSAGAASSVGAASQSSVPPISAAAAATGTAHAPGVLELLSAARVAFRDQKLLLPRSDGPPRGDSALELYTQVLAQDPHNDEALDGVRRLFALGKARIQSDLTTGRLDEAGRLVGAFKSAGVPDGQLAPLQAGIAAARPRWMSQRVQQSIAAGDLATADQLIGQLTASGAAPAQIAQLRRALDEKKLEGQLAAMAHQVDASIAAGHLLPPAEDDAQTRLGAMRALGRNQPATQAATHALQAALLQKAHEATVAAQYNDAQRFLDAAGALGSTNEVRQGRQDLKTAMTATRNAAAAAAAAATAKLEARARSAAPGSAPPAAKPATPAPRFVAGRPVRPLSVSYPEGTDAEGSVIIEFTLEPNGRADDPTVIQSTPPGVFDRTALDAVRGGRFDTHVLVKGQPARARILLRFKPN